jgi:hypothetical protein
MKRIKKLSPANRCDSCDAELDTKRRFCNELCRQTNLCRSVGTTKYRNKYVAPDFQEMIRAEFGAKPRGPFPAVVDGNSWFVVRRVGQCVCVTCGRVCPWSGGRGVERLNCGHFLAGRGSILFEEDCVAPQCAECNMHHGGRPLEFRKWMEVVRGLEVIERLERLKHQPWSYTLDELVSKRLEFSRRLKAAELKIKGTT